jgi:hypothetical protein
MNWRFRGKRVDNGEWIYGDLLQDKDLKTCYISGYEYYSSENGLEREPFSYEVDPSTVGLGIEIDGKWYFEGDVAKVNYGGETRIGEVTFELGGFYIKTKRNLMSLAGLCKIGFPFEVIGNKWDNPELLGKEGEGCK